MNSVEFTYERTTPEGYWIGYGRGSGGASDRLLDEEVPRSSSSARLSAAIGCLPHALLKVERGRNAVTALAELVGGTDVVVHVDQTDFAVGTDHQGLVGLVLFSLFSEWWISELGSPYGHSWEPALSWRADRPYRSSSFRPDGQCYGWLRCRVRGGRGLAGTAR